MWLRESVRTWICRVATIEQALLHHLPALRELPADLIIPPRIVVDEETAKAIHDRIDNPRAPTKAMEDLFSED